MDTDYQKPTNMAVLHEAPTRIPFNDQGPIQGEELWTHDLFGCFDDFRLCLFTFCCPCYTIGRNSQEFGEDGAIIGILYFLAYFAGAGLTFGPLLRYRLRQRKNIRGSMISDILMHLACPCCSLIQENKELFGLHGAHAGEKIPINVDISRQ